MELDELKSSWEKIGEQQGKFSQQELKNILRNESKSPFVKIRKSMMKELALFVGVLIFIYFIAINHSPFAMTLLTVVNIVFILFCSQFYIKIYKKSKEFQLTNAVSTELKTQINSLKSDLKYYRNLNLLFYFPAVFVGLVLGNKAFQNASDIISSNFNFWLWGCGIMLLLSPLYYLLVNFTIKTFYGKFIEELEDIQKELDSLK